MEGMIRGPIFGATGTTAPRTAGVSAAQRVQTAHSPYLDAVLGNRVFYMSLAAAAPTAYTGGAAGTPLFAAHNPANSKVVLVGMIVGIALRAAATAAGQTGLVAWSGPSVLPTGTRTNPTNALSQAASGSAAVGFANAALTGSTALTVAMPLFTHYWATAAGAIATPGLFDCAGIVVATPGNQIAVGLTVVPTSVTCDAAFYWEEVPLIG